MQGGADIVDVKEPLNGSLGRASAEALYSIGDVLADLPCAMPCKDPGSFISSESLQLSVALGEVTEWFAPAAILAEEFRAVIQRLRPAFLKLGLADMMTSAGTSDDWKQAWQYVRHVLPGPHAWVAVAYADHERAKSPAVNEVLHEAIACGCQVLLIDTNVKDGSTLLDWLNEQQLQQLRQATRAAGMQLALAGRVTEELLPTLFAVNPDIIGVRGAVCDHGQRTATVCELRVHAFRAALQSR